MSTLRTFFLVFFSYTINILHRLVFLVFDTSGPNFLCGDCGGLPELVVGSTLQADNGRKRSDKKPKVN